MIAPLILAIETSCDETSVAVNANGRTVLSNIIASQVDIHRPYGGVVPEIAARKHIENIGFIVDEALRQAGVSLEAIDAFAVANGPGLAGALLVGLSYAKALAFARQKPLIGVHHIAGHVCANYLESEWKPPFVSLVVSGGHTLLLSVKDYDDYEILGRTRDDAAGEAFDKVARALGLPYPGGPLIDKLARQGDPQAMHFPRSVFGETLDFSFSGLKSAVMQFLQRAANGLTIEDVAASFQQAVIDVLVGHTLLACERTGLTVVALAGGVASNQGLREAMEVACNARGYRLHKPAPVYCTDNAAMIACAGYYALMNGTQHGLDLNAYPSRDISALTLDRLVV